MSDQSHTAFYRAAVIAGIRRECIRVVPSNERFRLDMKALERTVAEDRAAGFNPVAVCANAGATSTGAVDPLEAMADFCEQKGIWLHVDAAYGGFAVVTDEGKRVLRGIERADSIGVDAHKWFFQPYEAGCLLVKDARTLENAFSVHHDVLQDTIWGAGHPNFADRGLQLSRSFRALKVWMSVQTFGMGAFRRAISKAMELAARAEEYVQASQILEVVNPAAGSVGGPMEPRTRTRCIACLRLRFCRRRCWDSPRSSSSGCAASRPDSRNDRMSPCCARAPRG